MKRVLIFFLVLCLSSPAQKIPFSILEQKSFLAASNARSCAVSSNYNVTYYSCRWNTDPAVNKISGSICMYFIPQPAVDSLQMDASVLLSIDSVLYHNLHISFQQRTGDVLHIAFPATVSSLDSVTVFYHGSPQGSGFGSFEQSTHGPNNIPVIWTLSEPYGAKDWWPCKMTLDDKADSIDTYITIPPGNRAASNGLLKSITPSGSNFTYHWKHRHPIAAYLVAQAVTNYSAFTDTAHLQSGTMPVLYYTYPEDSLAARADDEHLLTFIHFYDSLFVPYAFHDEKYGHAQFGWGGGMEHQTMSFVGGFFDELLAHELAHQWFGDKVTCGSWRDIWLNEGFAVYCTALSMSQVYGASYFRNYQESTINDVASLPGGSVYVDDTTSVPRIFSGRLTYNKGSYLLHMLRCIMGDNAFFQGVRNYLNDPVTAYAFGRTALLQHHLELVSGKDLTRFFTQWFYGQGFPSYLVLYSNTGNHYKVTLSQTTSHASVPFFQMPVPVEFKGNGKDTVIIFNNTINEEVFYVDLPFKADEIVFDPALNILSVKNKVMEENAYRRSFEDFVLYPNPATEAVNIEVNDLVNFPQAVYLYDVLGREVINYTPVENHFTLSLKGISEGTYYLKIVSGNKSSIHKLVKSR